MGEKHKAEALSHFENRLRAIRTAKDLSQGELARQSGITRQAIYAIEAGQYLPTTAVALRLASTLDCRVEDLFSLVSTGEVIEGDLVGGHVTVPPGSPVRVKVARVGGRIVVRPVATLGDVLNFTIPADGLMTGPIASGRRASHTGERVLVRLLRDRRVIDDAIVVAGCDPAIFLAEEHLRHRRGRMSVIEWTMGSTAALEALQRGEVHVAGLHLVDAKSGESNLPYLRRHLKGDRYKVVTFAAWEQGLMVKRGNPKAIREVADLGRKGVRMINREAGAGARLLLDRQLAAASVRPTQVHGFQQLAGSHLEVARAVAEGRADAGIGVRSAARLLGLEFIPLQEERYDLVIPKSYLEAHSSLSALLDAIVSRPFRTEIEALGGYDMRETGKVQVL